MEEQSQTESEPSIKRPFLLNPKIPYRRSMAVPRKMENRRRTLKAFKRIRTRARKAERNA